jgi:hypothetical protein|nr:MAG TPA: hypothetical protein [Caudoviricetes sp.]
MNKVVQEVIDRLREITGNEEQGFRTGRSWKEPIYTVLLKEEDGDDLPEHNEVSFTPVDYIRNRRKEDSQFLAWARVRTDEKEESKLDSAIWETIIKAINFCQCQNSDQGDVGYLMALTAAIDELIKYTKRDSIVDLRALEMANSMLIDQYLNDIYIREKSIVNGISGAVVTKCRPPMYMMPKTPELSILEVGNTNCYLDFMKVKGKRIICILEEVISQDRKLDGSRFGVLFMGDRVTLSLIDANQRVDQKYRLNYADWMKEYHDAYQRAFDEEVDIYWPIIHVLFYSHAICDAIGKKRIFSTLGFKMLLEEAQEVLVYSKEHFKMVDDATDDRYRDVINDAWAKIDKIDYLKFDHTVSASKNGIINDLECRLTVKKDELDLSFHIHVNNKAYLLAHEHVKHELKVSDEIAVDIIYLSLLKDFAAEYCRDKPLEKALSEINDGLDIRLMDKLSSVLTVRFIDGGLLDVSDFINDIGGLRYTYSLNYTIEGR